MPLARVAALALPATLVFALSAGAQEPGDRVVLESTNPRGVPVHPAAGDQRFVRWVNGTEAIVRSRDAETGWFEVDDGTSVGWVTPRYIVAVLGAADEEEDAEESFYVVGTWNLEHFGFTKARGFPENSPTYAPRTAGDYVLIADVIENRLGAQLLMLNEINGISGEKRSAELDSLTHVLGEEWAYELSRSGRDMRVAILYDTLAVAKRRCHEFVVLAAADPGK